MNIAIEQNTLLVPPQLAAEIGLHPAIVVQQMHYWTVKAKERGLGRLYDGAQWFFNSLDRWLEQFPFLSKYQLRRAIAKLKEAGLIFAEKKNKAKYDHTMWYTINYERLKPLLGSMCGFETIDDQVSEPIDDSTDHTSKTETSSETSTEKLEKPISKKKEQAEYDKWYESAYILGWVSNRDGVKVQMKRGLYVGRYFHWQEVAKNQEHFLTEPAPRQPGQYLRALAGKGFGKKLGQQS